MSSIESAITEAKTFAAKEHALYINGVHKTALAEETIETVDPSSGDVWARVQAGGDRDIDDAVRAAHACFEGPWSKVSARDREKLIRRFGDLIDKHADTLAALDSIDCGSVLSMLLERGRNLWLDSINYFAGWPTKIAGQSFAPTLRKQTAGRTTSLSSVYEPIGVVGCVLPWNAPAAFVLNKAIPALAAGCTVVVKPAEQTPISALFLAALFEEAGFPPGAFNVVNGRGETAGAALVSHPLVKKISFTGSTEVGQIIASASAKDFKRLTLELGGKSAFIVMADADLELAARTACFSGYFLSGQFCMCPSRLFVEDKAYDEFIEKLTGFASMLNVGDAYAQTTSVGPVITNHDRDRVHGVVNTAREEGAELVYGGNILERTGNFFEPTLLAKPDTKLALARDEVFGPVLFATPFKAANLDTLVAQANETEYGLAASVWTNNLKTGHELAARLHAGTVGVNDHATVDPMVPFGGVKQSGIGREFGQPGFESFLELKTVSICY